MVLYLSHTHCYYLNLALHKKRLLMQIQSRQYWNHRWMLQQQQHRLWMMLI